MIRARQAAVDRVARNDAAVWAGACQVLADAGWAGFTPSAISRVVGLSDKAVRARGSTPADLAAGLWRRVLGPALVAQINDLRGALQSSLTQDDPTPLTVSLASFVRDDTLARATVEALVIGHFEAGLREEIETSLGVAASDWIEASTTDTSRAQAGYLIALALGLLLTSHYPYAKGDIQQGLARHATAVLSAIEPQQVPDRPARHMDDYPELAPDDPTLDILLNQTLELIGTHGFDSVTVLQIASATGVSEGMIFHRYPTKLALFVDATRRQNQAGWQLNHDYVEALMREFPAGIVEAIHLREAQRPGRGMARAMMLEQLRLGRRHADVGKAAMQAMEDFYRQRLEQDPGLAEDLFYVREALDVGVCAVPLLFPNCWQLPYETITLPLNQASC